MEGTYVRYMYVRTMSPKSTKRHRTGSGERSDDPPGCRHFVCAVVFVLVVGDSDEEKVPNVEYLVLDV